MVIPASGPSVPQPLSMEIGSRASMSGRPQRKFPRIRSEHPVRVRLLGRDEVEDFGSTEVLGLGGCSVLVGRSFGPGTLVEIQIPMRGGMVVADGRVAYEIPSDGNEREIGIEFLRISPRHLARIRPLLE